jgi:hypothetical protein
MRFVWVFPVLLASIAPMLRSQTINVSFPADLSAKPANGRVLLLLSNDPTSEPRVQIDDTPSANPE